MLHGVHIILTIGNIVLLLILLYLFLQTYRTTRSNFALGLVIFISILLLETLMSCPIPISLFSKPENCPVEIFYTAASGFEFVALSILLYLVWV